MRLHIMRKRFDAGELLEGVTMKQLQDLFEMVLKRKEDKVDPIRSKFRTYRKGRSKSFGQNYRYKRLYKRKEECKFQDIIVTGAECQICYCIFPCNFRTYENRDYTCNAE